MADASSTGRATWAAAMALAFVACPPLAAQTLAGTAIVNVATARADAGGAVASNSVSLVVAERLDCALAPGSVGIAAVSVVLTNQGNGGERFVVAASVAPGSAPRPIAIDVAGEGRFDPARDRPLPDGTTPELAPGETVRLVIPLDAAAATSLTVTARAVTGSGAPGTVIALAGDRGGDAVVGATGASATLTIALAAEVPPTIVESQSVLAADGGAAARRGSLVTYTIVTRFASASPAARVVDPIPADAAYRAGTLALDGDTIADAGRVVDGRIVVALGAVAAGAVHRLSFQVIIQ